MTVPQKTELEVSSDTRSETLARLKAEMEASLVVHEERLAQDPDQDDISMAMYRRSEAARSEILTALAHMEDGTYGVCTTCGGLISEDRLEAIPHTVLCMVCAR